MDGGNAGKAGAFSGHVLMVLNRLSQHLQDICAAADPESLKRGRNSCCVAENSIRYFNNVLWWHLDLAMGVRVVLSSCPSDSDSPYNLPWGMEIERSRILLYCGRSP